MSKEPPVTIKALVRQGIHVWQASRVTKSLGRPELAEGIDIQPIISALNSRKLNVLEKGALHKQVVGGNTPVKCPPLRQA